MGSCMSGDKEKQSLQYFRKDLNILQKSQVFEPLTTTLFNTMRKYNDTFVVFADSGKAKQFQGLALQSIKSMPAKSIKMMYSFKKLVVIGSWSKCQKDLTQLLKQASISSIYVIEPRIFEKFQKQYSIFTSQQSITSVPTSKIPLMVFNSQQLVKPPQKPYSIFIHSVDQRDSQIYSKLKIEGVIEPSSSTNQEEEIKYFVDKLKSNSYSRVVLLHTRALGPAALMSILSEYLMFLYEPNQISVKGYLARTLPNVTILSSMATEKMLDQASKIRSSSSQVVNNLDEFHRLFKQYINQSNPQKAQRTYNLLGKLLANIIANPDAENYRKVKAINKQMQELLTRSSSGIKLLKLTGFNQKSGFWVNDLQAKYLKVLRGDMDLGFRKAFTQTNQNQQNQ